MVPALAPISVVIVCLESIRAINIPKVKYFLICYIDPFNNNQNQKRFTISTYQLC